MPQRADAIITSTEHARGLVSRTFDVSPEIASTSARPDHRGGGRSDTNPTSRATDTSCSSARSNRARTSARCSTRTRSCVARTPVRAPAGAGRPGHSGRRAMARAPDDAPRSAARAIHLGYVTDERTGTSLCRRSSTGAAVARRRLRTAGSGGHVGRRAGGRVTSRCPARSRRHRRHAVRPGRRQASSPTALRTPHHRR